MKTEHLIISLGNEIIPPHVCQVVDKDGYITFFDEEGKRVIKRALEKAYQLCNWNDKDEAYLERIIKSLE